MGEPGGLLSMGSHRVGHDWSDLAAVAEPVMYGDYIYIYSLDANIYMVWILIKYWQISKNSLKNMFFLIFMASRFENYSAGLIFS